MTHRPSQPRTDSPRYLTEERIAIRDLAREFAMTQVLPVANELDPVQGTIPDALKKAMAEVGFFGIMIPEEFGGLGLGVFEYCLVAEELSRAWMSVSGLLARGNGMGGGFTPEQEAALLPRVARGEYLGAYALSEAEAGSDVANISCRATREGDEWVVNGTKMWCTYADEADYLVLFVRTDPNKDPAKPHRGISTFLVEKERGVFPEGISGTKVRKIGYFGWSTWELSFEDFRIPADRMLGEEGKVSTSPSAVWRWAGHIPRPAPSDSRAPPSRTPSPTCTPVGSSATSSPTSSTCGSRSPRWPPTSRPPASSCTPSPPTSTPVAAARWRRRCANSSPPRWPNA